MPSRKLVKDHMYKHCMMLIFLGFGHRMFAVGKSKNFLFDFAKDFCFFDESGVFVL